MGRRTDPEWEDYHGVGMVEIRGRHRNQLDEWVRATRVPRQASWYLRPPPGLEVTLWTNLGMFFLIFLSVLIFFYF